MPEIGECYSIAEKIPELGTIEKVSISINGQKNIVKKNQNLNSLKGCFIEKPFAYGKSVLFPIRSPKGKLGILCSQLGMTGSWFLDEAFIERGNDHFILFAKDHKLRYSDPRMFGKLELYTGNSIPEILEDIIKDHKWGIDPIKNPDKSLPQLLKLKKSGSEIKRKLLEQNLICGIGNYLASEVLFVSKINPVTPCKDISDSQYQALAKAINKTVLLAKKHQGFSFAGGYILPDGSWGDMKDFILIYGKEKCPVCDSKVVVQDINNRVTYYCKKCQSK